jgi:hypothetical protein
LSGHCGSVTLDGLQRRREEPPVGSIAGLVPRIYEAKGSNRFRRRLDRRRAQDAACSVVKAGGLRGGIALGELLDLTVDLPRVGESQPRMRSTRSALALSVGSAAWRAYGCCARLGSDGFARGWWVTLFKGNAMARRGCD